MPSTFYYLYCLKDKTQRDFDVEGIDKKRVYVLAHKDIGAVLTRVDSEKFSQKRIGAKLKDLKWVEEKVRNHEGVIATAMEDSPVIPSKFMTLFGSEEKIRDSLKKQYKKFRELLDALRGKTEYGVKVYIVDKEVLANIVEKEDEEILKMKEESISKTEGAEYFLEKKLKKRVSEKVDERLDRYAKDILGTLSRFSVEKPVMNKLLPAELTGKSKEMILSASYLVLEKKLEEFQRAIARLGDYYFPKGLWIEQSGPWPPYSFVNHANKNKNSR